jgi:hypothetical protein
MLAFDIFSTLGAAVDSNGSPTFSASSAAESGAVANLVRVAAGIFDDLMSPVDIDVNGRADQLTRDRGRLSFCEMDRRSMSFARCLT